MGRILLRALPIAGFLVMLGFVGWMAYDLRDGPPELRNAYMMVVGAAIVKQVREKGLDVSPIHYWSDIFSQSFEWLVLAKAGQLLVEATL